MARNGQTFQPGHQSKGARPHGSLNQITRDLKQGIVDAAIKHGSNGRGAGGLQGFFKYMIKNDLRAFASLMGRVIPLQINGNINGTIAAVTITPVPAGHFLTAEQVKASMTDYSPTVIAIRPNMEVIEEPPTAEDVA